jgi:hypothetical protein
VVVGAAFQEKGAADAIVAVRRAVLEADVKVVGKVVGAGEGGQRQRQVARQRAERGNVEVAAACRQRQREQCQGTSEHERLEHDTGSLIIRGSDIGTARYDALRMCVVLTNIRDHILYVPKTPADL